MESVTARVFCKTPQRHVPDCAAFSTALITHDFHRADAYAGRGYLTVLVNTAGRVEDIETKEVEKNGKRKAFIHAYACQKLITIQPDFDTEEIIHSTIEYLRNVYNVHRIGAIGYCGGGTPAFELLSSGRAVVGFVAHPSYVTHEKLKGIKAPLSIASPENDRHMPKALRDDVEGWLKDIGLPWQLAVYSGVTHGFGSRYPTKCEDEERGKRMAFGQAVAWIDEFLPGN